MVFWSVVLVGAPGVPEPRGGDGGFPPMFLGGRWWWVCGVCGSVWWWAGLLLGTFWVVWPPLVCRGGSGGWLWVWRAVCVR